MTTTLCEKCFPDDGSLERYSLVPFVPCEQCGWYDNRHKGGPVVHSFPRDPRPVVKEPVQ